MPRRSRYELESDIQQLIRRLREIQNNLPVHFQDLPNSELYNYEKVLKATIKTLKPYTFN